jgi:acid phosphatase (class A)
MKASAIILGLLALTAPALAQQSAAPDGQGVVAQARRVPGYLIAATTPDAYATIPPAPQAGEPRNDADWKIFRDTRALEGSERWKLAQNDNALRAADLLKDFSCSVGAELTPQNAPTLSTLISRVTVDAGSAANRAKDIYKRTRPFLHNPGNICIDRNGGIADSFDYPSGHSSLGWAVGLSLAQIAPDHATNILARARAYGESRIVCGVHNWSAVEAGRTNASGVYAALQGNADFRADLEKARTEVATARASGPKLDAAACAKEAELAKPLVLK